MYIRRIVFLVTLVMSLLLSANGAQAANVSQSDDQLYRIAAATTGLVVGKEVNTRSVSTSEVTLQGGTHRQLRRDGETIQAMQVTSGGSTIRWNVLRPGQRLVPSNGGFTITNHKGETIALVHAPWAVDSAGLLVSTWYSVDHNVLLQHIGASARKVVADPSISKCDWWSHICVRFNRTETRRLSGVFFLGFGATTNVFCGMIPLSSALTTALRAVCTLIVAVYFFELRTAFQNATRHGHCEELKFDTFALLVFHSPILDQWKEISC